ncbi:MAG: Na+-transporting NADH:ubiquinone oxidoreductase subunit C [Planctomycetota bacterium]
MEFSNRYIVGFAVILCLVCALGVSSAAVGLRDLQQTNELLFKQKNVLMAAGIMEAGAEITPEEVTAYFENIHERVIDRVSGAVLEEDSSKIDPIKLAAEEETSAATPSQFKGTQVKRLPNKLLVYDVGVEGHEGLVLPIHGSGLWSTLFGFIALSPDGMTIKGITYYAHGETPGLGGEVENPKWRAQWPGKLAVDADGKVLVQVLKPGLGENPDTDVDGLSGATITSNGVHNMLQLWLGEHGYGPYLKTKR